jgi:hypothetical protein
MDPPPDITHTMTHAHERTHAQTRTQCFITLIGDLFLLCKADAKGAGAGVSNAVPGVHGSTFLSTLHAKLHSVKCALSGFPCPS